MNLFEAQELAIFLMKKHLLLDWTFNWNNRKSSFGLCSYRKKSIQLSKVLTAVRPEEDVRNTILHEIAHALVGSGHGHNDVWRNMCYRIGMTKVTRCSDFNATEEDKAKVLKPKFVMVCPKGKVIKKYQRKLNQKFYE